MNERLEKIFGGKVPEVDLGAGLDLSQYARNCENVIGVVTLPVGVVGPLRTEEGREYRLPLATTEACLVASVNRGAKVLRQAGGATVRVRHCGISRAPVYRLLKQMTEAEVRVWVAENEARLQAACETVSGHTRLLRTEVRVVEGNLHMRHWFDTGEAMGMNMATIATKAMAEQVVETGLPVRLVAVSSNWCSDKKPSETIRVEGRKYQVEVGVTVTDEILRAVLHCGAEELQHVAVAKLEQGSALAGMTATNSHHANIIAGVYAALGQDLAHIVAGSQGVTKVEATPAGLRVGVELPAVVVGVLGGGTRLPLQGQYQSLIGLTAPMGHGERTAELAGVVGLGVLAGEISLLGALAAKGLAGAHEKFR